MTAAPAAGPQCSASVKAKYDHRIDAYRIKPFQWKPGQSGNPGGKPKVDLAAEIARAIFENNGPAIYAAFSKALRKGDAYAFKELADRAFGRLKETHQHEISPYKDMSDEDLVKRVKQLERELVGSSTARELPPADESSDSKPN